MTPDPSPSARPRRSRPRISLVLGAFLVAAFVLCAALAPLLTRAVGYGPFDQVTPRTVTPPTPPDRDHLLGTDSLGRDLLSRLVNGARISLEAGILAEVIAVLLGTIVGACAGYAGGRPDAVLMRCADLVFAFPEALLALAIIAAVPDPETAPLVRHLPHPSVGMVFLVLGLIGWAKIARLVRGEVLKIRTREFAQAAQAIGARGARVVLRHLLPNTLGPLIVAGTLGIGGNILLEAWLSFLGVGARPPLPSWGTMITEGQAYILSKPWVCVAPGLAILAAVLGFNLLGDGIRDLLDPRRRGAAVILVLVLGAAALPGLACGGAGSAPKAEQVFRFRLREDPPTLDPALSTDNLSGAVLNNVFRGLVEVDPGTLQIRPAVAASWTISPDRLTYTFRLRDGVLFQNGRPVGARDVEYSFQRTLRKETNAPWRWALEPIDGSKEFTEGRSPTLRGLKVTDDRTVELRLAKPFAPLLGMLSLLPAAIVPREIYDDPAKAYLRAPVGCGPFRVSRWEQSNFIELLAFDGFYGGRPALDRVVVRMIENRMSATEEYRAGGLDSLDEVPPDDDEALQAELGPEIHRYPYLATGYIGFNHALPPFKGNVKLRQAINYAVDKRYLWGVLIPGNIPAHGIIPPGLPGYDPDLPGYPYDEAKAKRLLAEAGYPGGRGLPPIALWVNTSEDNRRIAERIQADLKAIGVGVTIREVDWSAYIKAVEGTADRPGEAQMFRFGWFLDYPDTDAVLRPLLHSANFGPAGNHFRYRNPRVDELLDRALVETDPAARARLYRDVERIAVMEDAVWLFLNYYESATLFKPYVKGIVLTPLGEFRIPLERLRIEKGSS